MDDKVASYILAVIASAGIIATSVCIAHVQNLKQDLYSKELEVTIWKRNYVSALSKMTPSQIAAEMKSSANNVKFINIVKDI